MKENTFYIMYSLLSHSIILSFHGCGSNSGQHSDFSDDLADMTFLIKDNQKQTFKTFG